MDKLWWALTMTGVLAISPADAQALEVVIGNWSGIVTREDIAPHALELNVWRDHNGKLAGLARYDYPRFTATTHLAEQRQSGGSVWLRETCEPVPESGYCYGGSIVLALGEGGRLDWTWRWPQGHVGAKTQLERSPVSSLIAYSLARAQEAERLPAATSAAVAAPPDETTPFVRDLKRSQARLALAAGEVDALFASWPSRSGQGWRGSGPALDGEPADAVSLGHLLRAMPAIGEWRRVMRSADALLRQFATLQPALAPSQTRLDEVAQALEGARAALDASPRELAIAQALQAHGAQWDAARPHAGASRERLDRFDRVARLATSGPALRQCLDAAAAHRRITLELTSQARGLAKPASAYLLAVVSVLEAADEDDAVHQVRRTLQRLDAADIPDLDLDAAHRAVATADAEDTPDTRGFDKWREVRALPAPVARLGGLLRLPRPEHLPVMLRTTIERTPFDDPLRERLLDVERRALAATAALAKDAGTRRQLEALQTPQTRGRLNRLATAAADGDGQAGKALGAEAGRLLVDGRLQPWTQIGLDLDAIEREAFRRWQANGRWVTDPLRQPPSVSRAEAGVAWARTLFEARMDQSQRQDIARTRERHRQAQERAEAAAEARERSACLERAQERPCVQRDQYGHCIDWGAPMQCD